MKYILPEIYAANSYPFRNGYKTTKIKETKNGYLIHRFSNYISLQFIKIVYNDKGFSKATVRVNTNYLAPYRYTLYFDNNGKEIKSENNNTRQELKIWKNLQKTN